MNTNAHPHPEHDGHDHDEHDQEHSHDHEAGHTHYGLPFFLIAGFALVEALGGWWTHSLALLSDAGHMAIDAISLGLAWWAATAATRAEVKRHASGMSYPELWASSINLFLMVVLIIGIVVEALARWHQPPVVAGATVFWIALAGLIMNLVVAKQLGHQAHSHGDNLNHEAAYIHVLGDIIGSLAAIIAGAVIYFSGWMLIDPLLSLLSAILLTGMTLRLAKRMWLSLRTGV